MRILQVCPKYYPDVGGLEEHVRNISERLAVKHEVTIATTDPTGKLDKTETINSVNIIRFKSWAPNQSYFFSKNLKRYLKTNSKNFDIVHAHSYSAFPALYAAQTKCWNKFVFTAHYHGTGHTFFRAMLHKPYKLLGKQIFKNADKIICVSKYEKDLVLRNFKVDDKKTTVIPNGVDLQEFSGLKKQNAGYPVILYVGRLEKYKGIQYLVKVLPKLDKDIRLEIVGKGPYKANLINLVQRENVFDRVTFFEDLPRSELLKKYSKASLFCLLSEHEAYGIVVAEALGCGIPCIVSKTSALTEWIDDENCFGIEYPIDTSELMSLITKTIGIKIPGVKLLDWTDITRDLEAVYDSVL